MKGKTLVVTGAASGIGRSTCELFLSKGWHVAAIDIDRSEINNLGKCHEKYSNLITEVANVTDPSSVSTTIEKIAGSWNGKIDVLFNSAGVLFTGPFEKLENKDISQLIDVNIKGTINAIQAVLPYMKKLQHGRVINMSSASAIYGIPDFSVYSASKFAIRGLTEALNIELASDNIHVCDIMPSFVHTPMLTGLNNKPKSIEKMGVKLNSDEIANQVFRSLSSSRVHHVLPLDVRFLNALSNLFPFLRKSLIRVITGY